MKNFGKQVLDKDFETSIPYPTKPSLHPACEKCSNVSKGTVTMNWQTYDIEIKQAQFCTHCGNDNKAFIEKQWKTYSNSKKAYDEDSQAKAQAFREGVIAEVGLTNHPKADKAYSYAWEKGHASGLFEVYQVLLDVAELVKD